MNDRINPIARWTLNILWWVAAWLQIRHEARTKQADERDQIIEAALRVRRAENRRDIKALAKQRLKAAKQGKPYSQRPDKRFHADDSDDIDIGVFDARG